MDDHATMINFEIPASNIPALSTAFRLMESNKKALCITDYALSQSTLEQVFLKQIRPRGGREAAAAPAPHNPTASDYMMGYWMWAAAALLPGLHHFYMGNWWRGLKYLFMLNELYVGWALDLFELHVMIQKRAEQYGSGCCASCFARPPVDPDDEAEFEVRRSTVVSPASASASPLQQT